MKRIKSKKKQPISQALSMYNQQYKIGGTYDEQYMAMTTEQEQLKNPNSFKFKNPQLSYYDGEEKDLNLPVNTRPSFSYEQSLEGAMTDYGEQLRQEGIDAIAPQTKEQEKFANKMIAQNEVDSNNNQKFQFFNPYLGRDPQTSAYGLGESIQNKDGLGIAGNAIHLLTSLGRNAFAGAGNAKREQYVMQDAMEKYREGLKPPAQSRQDGGYIKTGNTNIKQDNRIAGYQEGGIAGQMPPQIQSPQEEQMEGNDSNAQEDGQEQQLMQQVASALQQGADPNQILQQLVKMGIPTDAATQLIEGIMQQMQGGQQQNPQEEQVEGVNSNPQEEGQESYQMGGVKKKSLPKLLTGEYIAENSDTEEEDIVAEVESDEYIKTPNGQITQVLGKTHEQGGVQLTEEQLPQNSEILSDHLTLPKDIVTIFKEIGVTTKDTYAKALEKWTVKSGLKKIVDEQEEIIKKLKNQSKLLVERPSSKDTIKINTTLLQEGISELEKEKEPLLKEKQAIFDQLFALQEASKQQEKQEQIMQKGGTFNSDVIVKYAKKHGISTERANELVNEYRTGGVAKYQDGTKIGVDSLINVYSKNKRERQHATGKAFGVVDPTIALKELYNNFPDIIDSEAVFKKYITVDDKGQPKFKSNLKLNEASTVIGNMQMLVDERMRDSANVIIRNPSNFSEQAVKEAQRYLKEETFMSNPSGAVSDADSIRDFDNKLGNFSAGRYAMKMNLITPEDKKLLDNSGIRTLRQLKNSPLRDKLSKTSLDNVKNIENLIGDSNADYAIGEIPTINKTEQEPTSDKTEQEPTINKTEQEPTSDKIVDTTNKFSNLNTAQRVRTGIMALPNQYAQLPDPLQGALKLEYRPNLLENQNITADPIVAEIRRSEQNAMQSIQNLPDEQRTAAAAQIQANTQEQFNKVMSQVQGQNLQSNLTVDNQNAQILNNSQDINNRYLSEYENKIYKAQSLTDADRKNYFLHNQKVDLENFNAVNKANLYNQLADNYQLTDRGLEIYNSPQLSYDGISADQSRLNTLRNAEKIKVEEKKALGKNGGRFKKRIS